MRDSILTGDWDSMPDEARGSPARPPQAEPFDALRSTSPRPDMRVATAVYKDRAVRVEVLQDVVSEGTHITVTVDDPKCASGERTIEYITNYAMFDEALGAGLEVARAAVEGRER